MNSIVGKNCHILDKPTKKIETTKSSFYMILLIEIGLSQFVPVLDGWVEETDTLTNPRRMKLTSPCRVG
jgi:hypothetical protein